MSDEQTEIIRGPLSWFAAVWFLGFICLPLAVSLTPLKDAEPLRENRELAARPDFGLDRDILEAFPGAFDAYFNDHFGLRNGLIRLHHRFKIEFLGVSPTDQVAVGDDGYLFLLSNYGADYQRAAPWPRERVEAYAKHLEQRCDWLAARGIKCLFVVAPNKATIYSEYAPGPARPLSESSILDQLYDYLGEYTSVPFVDLRPALLEAKQTGAVYYKNDTHWNEYGQYVAYREIVNRLGAWFPALQPLPPEQFKRTTRTTRRGDLSGMMAATDLIDEEVVEFRLTGDSRAKGPLDVDGYTNENVRRDLRVEAFENPDATVRAVFMRDSFGNRLVPFLKEHFQRLVCWPYNTFRTDIVTKTQPDVVIMEICERYLLAPLPKEQPIVQAAERD